MLTYSFADIGSDSLYEYLYKCIKNDIISRKIKPGEKLPSKRSFAKNLGISVITVENAYDQLMGEGYIYSIEKKGYYASDINADHVNGAAEAGGDIEGRRPEASSRALNEETGENAYVADYSSNRINIHQFPFTVWSKLLRECLADYREELLIKSPAGGARVLREAIANHLKAFRDLDIDPEQIIIGAGTEYLYSQIVQLLGRDKIYGVEDPGFPKTSQVYSASGANVRYIPLDNEGIDVEELERVGVQVAHISPAHQFPTGRVTPISRRYELLRWAYHSDDRYIIEDDYDSEFRLTGRPIPTLKRIDINDRVIYLNTFSKSIANTVRVSYMVLPKTLLEEYNRKMSFYSCPVPSIIQLTVARFISDGYFEKHINRLRSFYRKQRNLIIEEMRSSGMDSYARIKEEDAGLHFLLDLDIPCTDKEFTDLLGDRGVKMCAVSEYYHRPDEASMHEFVVNYSSLSEEQIKLSVKLLNETILQF